MKIDAIFFGWFVPFFFVGTGIKFDFGSITGNTTSILLVPISLALFCSCAARLYFCIAAI